MPVDGRGAGRDYAMQRITRASRQVRQGVLEYGKTKSGEENYNFLELSKGSVY